MKKSIKDIPGYIILSVVALALLLLLAGKKLFFAENAEIYTVDNPGRPYPRCETVGTPNEKPVFSQKEISKWLPGAKIGDPQSQYNLAQIYIAGDNYVEGIKWIRMAAEHALASAQAELGLLYRDGKGVPQDLVEAYFWSKLASANDCQTQKIESYLTAAQLAEADKRVAAWKPAPTISHMPTPIPPAEETPFRNLPIIKPK